MGRTPFFRDETANLAEPATGLMDLRSFAIINGHYPRIADTIVSLWGKRELDIYFDQLVLKDREDRSGFPPAVMEALLALSAEHVRQFRLDPLDSYDDVWDPFVKHAHRP